MISHSEARQFRQCQRKWYFKYQVASWNSRDPQRREAFVLSKLQSLMAWRGSIVDKVVSTTLVEQLKRKRPVDADALVARARVLYDGQREFALRHRVREPDLRVGQHGDTFAAWYDVEYGAAPDEAVLAALWNDIEKSLRTAASMQELIASLQTAKLVAQPRLSCDLGLLKVAANPDVVAIYPNNDLRIVDWKVHAFGLRAAKQQLTVYAGVLRAGGAPWLAVPPSPLPLDRITLTEAQLLNNEVHDYSVTEDDIDECFDEMFDIATEMEHAIADLDDPVRGIATVAVTPWVEQCDRCSYKRLCKEQTT